MECVDLSSIYKVLSQRKEPYRILLLCAKDVFFKEDCLDRYVHICRQAGWQVVIDESTSMKGMREKGICGEDLFAQPTVYVLVRDKMKVEEQEEAMALVEQASKRCFFLFVVEDAKDDFLSFAKKEGALFKIPMMKPWEKTPKVVQWIKAYCAKRGATIQVEAAAMVSGPFVQDCRGLKNELDKLLLGASNESYITEQDVRQLCDCSSSSSLFQLLDGLLYQDPALVAKAIYTSADVYDIGVVRFIKNQLEKAVAVERGIGEGKTGAQRRQSDAVRSVGPERIFKWIHDCCMYEVLVRSGKKEASRESLLEFFLDMCF